MDFIKDINSETLVICNSNIKDIIMNMHILKPIKFMNMVEFFHKYFLIMMRIQLCILLINIMLDMILLKSI